MILVLMVGLGVIILVAVLARRDGRDVLTLRGEEVVAKVRERTSRASPDDQDPQQDPQPGRSIKT